MDSKKATKRGLDSSKMDSKKPKTDASFDAVFPTREQFLESCKAQTFSFPIPIMKYVWSNPSSPEVYEKLIKTCKLFSLKNPILVLNGLDYDYKSGWKYCPGIECDGMLCNCERKKFDMEKLQDKRIWISKSFSVFTSLGLNANPDFVSQFIPKIHRYDVTFLAIHNQNLSYEEVQFLATGLKGCYLDCNTVTYGNGESVPFEEIIKLFSGCSIWIVFDNVSANATCKSYDAFIKACNTVRNVTLHLIPAIFNVHDFYQQLKLTHSRALINIDSASNKTILDSVIAEILQTQSFAFIPPVIKYNGQNESDLKKMEEIQAREAAKYN